MLTAGDWCQCLVVAAALAAGACGPPRPATETMSGALGSSPVIGAELPVDDVVYTQQSGQQTTPFIAGGGPGALLVWRNDPLPGFQVSPVSIDFARIDPQGTLLDPLPVTIGTPTDLVSLEEPVAAWNGDQALVLWLEGVPGAGDVEVRGTRITRDGTVLDPGTADLPGGIVVELGRQFEVYDFSVIPFGDGFMVFWASSSLSPFCTRVGADGSVVNTAGSPVALPADGVTRSIGNAAPVTGGALVTVGESGATGSGLKVMKVDGNGAALTPLSDLAGASGTSLTGGVGIASNGGNGAFLCWGEQSASGQPVTIYGRRIDANAAWVDAAAFQIRAAGGQVGQIGAIWDGTRYLCSWTDKGTAVRAAFQPVAASGTPLVAATVGPSTLATTSVQTAQIAWTGSAYAVAMTRTETAVIQPAGYGANPDGVLLRMLDANLQLLGTDAVPVTRQPNQQTTPRAAATPNGVYVTYTDDRRRGILTMQGNYNQDVYGAFVTVSGGALTKTVAPLSVTAYPAYDPSVVWTGSQLMLFYATNPDSDTAADFVQLAGASGATVGSRIGPLGVAYTGDPAVTLWNGQNLLVATVIRDGGGEALNYFRVSPAGVVLDPSTAKTGGPQVELGQWVMTTLQGVALGDKYLLIGQQAPELSTGASAANFDVVGLVVNADATPGTTRVVPIATGTDVQDVPVAATDGSGTSAVMVWRDRSPASSAIVAARVDATLARLDATDVVIAQASPPSTLGPPAVAWTGSAYAVVWTEGSGGTLAFDGCLLGADLHCVAGSQSSTPSGIGDMPAAAVDGGVPASGEVQAPTLSWTAAGGVLSYQRLDTTPFVGVQRLFLRPVTLGAAPPQPDGGAGGGGGGHGGSGGTKGVGGATGTGAGGTSGAGGAATGGRGGAGGSGGPGGASGAAGSTSGSAGGGGAPSTGDTIGSSPDAGAGATTGGGGSGCGCALGGDVPASVLGVLLIAGFTLSRRRRG
ncbi:MAG TPA: hypothetical protein VHO06_09575 [Polyangia bacterium]|nr:hypothetical protein [Polyangia bacterium]